MYLKTTVLMHPATASARVNGATNTSANEVANVSRKCILQIHLQMHVRPEGQMHLHLKLQMHPANASTKVSANRCESRDKNASINDVL